MEETANTLESEFRTAVIAISYDVLKQHFGRKLEDAAESFHGKLQNCSEFARFFVVDKLDSFYLEYGLLWYEHYEQEYGTPHILDQGFKSRY